MRNATGGKAELDEPAATVSSDAVGADSEAAGASAARGSTSLFSAAAGRVKRGGSVCGGARQREREATDLPRQPPQRQSARAPRRREPRPSTGRRRSSLRAKDRRQGPSKSAWAGLDRGWEHAGQDEPAATVSSEAVGAGVASAAAGACAASGSTSGFSASPGYEARSARSSGRRLAAAEGDGPAATVASDAVGAGSGDAGALARGSTSDFSAGGRDSSAHAHWSVRAQVRRRCEKGRTCRHGGL